MKIEIDKTIYSDSCISKTVYWFTKEFDCIRVSEGEKEIIEIHNKLGDGIDEQNIRSKFLSHLNDNKLRDIITKETKDINTILYLKAFAHCEDFTDQPLDYEL